MNPTEWRKWVHSRIGHKPDDFSPDDLHFIANGPLCDPERAFCPAGKLSMAETREREARQKL